MDTFLTTDQKTSVVFKKISSPVKKKVDCLNQLKEP